MQDEAAREKSAELEGTLEDSTILTEQHGKAALDWHNKHNLPLFDKAAFIKSVTSAHATGDLEAEYLLAISSFDGYGCERNVPK